MGLPIPCLVWFAFVLCLLELRLVALGFGGLHDHLGSEKSEAKLTQAGDGGIITLYKKKIRWQKADC